MTTPRPQEVAALAGVPVEQLRKVDEFEVRSVLGPIVTPEVLECATSQPANYWCVGTNYYLDDGFYGPVCCINTMYYDSTLGLCAAE